MHQPLALRTYFMFLNHQRFLHFIRHFCVCLLCYLLLLLSWGEVAVEGKDSRKYLGFRACGCKASRAKGVVCIWSDLPLYRSNCSLSYAEESSLLLLKPTMYGAVQVVSS